jgi:hypothetical protein
MPGIQQLICLCENGPSNSSSEHRQLSCGSLALYFVILECTFLVFGKAMISIKKRGADGVKIAVLRKGRASSAFILAAAHTRPR